MKSQVLQESQTTTFKNAHAIALSALATVFIGGYAPSAFADEYTLNNQSRVIDSAISDTLITPALVTGTSSPTTIVTATNNTLTLQGNFVLNPNAKLYGAWFSGTYDTASSDLFSGNTLNIDLRQQTTPLKVNTIGNFKTINLNVGNVKAGDTLIDLGPTGKMQLGMDTNIEIKSIDAKNLAVGASFTIINRVDNGEYGINVLENDGIATWVSAGDSVAIKYLTEISADYGTLDIYGHGEDGVVKAEIVAVAFNNETTVFNTSRVASLAFINTGNDLITSQLRDLRGKHLFGIVSGSHNHYKANGAIDVNGANLIVGATASSENDVYATTAGAFFEAGAANTVTSSYIGHKRLSGSGNANYYGVGLLGKIEQIGGAYLDGALRVGRLSDDYKNSDLVNASGQKASHDGDSLYYGMQLGAGYRFAYQNVQTDAYLRYYWNHLDADTRMISSDKYRFSAMDSKRLRVGMMFSPTVESTQVKPFVGIAWEHEFDGRAKGRVYQFELDDVDIKGSNMLLQAGIDATLDSKDLWHMRGELTGYSGERSGISGMLRLDYKF